MNRESPKRESISRRLLFCLATAAAIIALGIIVGINRDSRADGGRISLPRTQAASTEPQTASAGSVLEETIARFLDERTDLAERLACARRLMDDGSPAALAALLKVFQTASPDQQAFLVQLIGSTGDPAFKAWLLPLLDHPEQKVRVAAIRALSAIGGEDIVARIASLLEDKQQKDLIRIEAAMGLGTIGTSSARDALLKSFGQTPSRDLAEQILKSLGRFDFPTVADAFQGFIATSDAPRAMRVVAVEALVNSSSEAVPFLLQLAARDTASEVRASAAWAIIAHEAIPHLGPALTDLAQREPAVDVRRRLYEALLPQSEVPAERLLPIVQAEQDVAARVAGFNVVGNIAREDPASSIATTFDREMVPELVRIATAPNSLNIQMRAVFALRRAQTEAAQAALAVIASGAPPQVATAARNGLPASQQLIQKGNP